jgi:hypothetical protein
MREASANGCDRHSYAYRASQLSCLCWPACQCSLAVDGADARLPPLQRVIAGKMFFEHDTGGREISGNFLIDNTRLVQKIGVQYAPFRQRVPRIIDDVRKDEGRPALKDK